MDDLDALFVRNATLADGPRSSAILRSVLHEYGIDPDPDEVALALHSSFVERVAQIDEELVGFASMRPNGDREGWVVKLFVDAEFRGLGVGRLLLRELEDEGRTRGWTRLGLTTRTVFREAIALYESRGWVRDTEAVRGRKRGRDRTYYLAL